MIKLLSVQLLDKNDFIRNIIYLLILQLMMRV